MFCLICALNKRLSKQSLDWWFEKPSRSLWRHCNDFTGTGPIVRLYPLQLWRPGEWVGRSQQSTRNSIKVDHTLSNSDPIYMKCLWCKTILQKQDCGHRCLRIPPAFRFEVIYFNLSVHWRHLSSCIGCQRWTNWTANRLHTRCRQTCATSKWVRFGWFICYSYTYSRCCFTMVMVQSWRIGIQWNLSVTTTSIIRFITCD